MAKLNFLKDLARDKKLHLLAGAGAGLVGAMIGANIGVPPLLAGLIAGVFAGGLKELYDAVSDGTVDLMDAVYTLAGSAPTAAFIALVA